MQSNHMSPSLPLVTGEVLRGDQIGRTIGFPTLNLDAELIELEQEGVYACSVVINDQSFTGALYWGPRVVLGETQRVLEIFVLDFDREIYGEKVAFQVTTFIRGVVSFSSLEELQQQLSSDVALIAQHHGINPPTNLTPSYVEAPDARAAILPTT